MCVFETPPTNDSDGVGGGESSPLKRRLWQNEAVENSFSLFLTLPLSVAVSLHMWAGSQR